jgi:hypothetical protein
MDQGAAQLGRAMIVAKRETVSLGTNPQLAIGDARAIALATGSDYRFLFHGLDDARFLIACQSLGLYIFKTFHARSEWEKSNRNPTSALYSTRIFPKPPLT